MRFTTRMLGGILGAALTAGCADYNSTEPQDETFSSEDKALVAAGGSTLTREGDSRILRATGDIKVPVTIYRALLGDLNPNTAGQKPSGRREVNWDGVPAAFTDTDAFPGNFFNVNSPRGVLFLTVGVGFRVSDNGFVDVNADYAGAFKTFSPVRTFSAVGSTQTEVQFVVAGENTPALVTGFGSVFADADHSGSARIDYFGKDGKLLKSVQVPRKNDAVGLSFAGVVFDTPIVARVRIVSGQAPLSATTADVDNGNGSKDLVVMDDFIYGEPQKIQ